MGLRIRTNIASINAQRRMGISTRNLQNSSAKLSSGKRINKAADDAAGLAISENMRADARSLQQARRNALDGVSLVQTAEGSLVETSNMLVRLRELAVQSASDTVGTTERQFINKEYVALKDEIDRIANSTEFNGTRLLVGNDPSLQEELANAPDTFPLEIQVGKDYYASADAKSQGNQVNIIKIDLENINAFTTAEGLNLGVGEDESGTLVSSKTKAQEAISILDQAITKVNDYRSYLGAIQNRLGSSVNNLESGIENIMESKSRIVDTDFAAETAQYTQASILQQAGSAVLAQANLQPQVALNLLQNI